MQFYGWAADNQMPISETKIDWGDGSQNLLKGKYKNHKFSCSGAGFGDSSGACQPGYFEFTHIYGCNAEKLSKLDVCGSETLSTKPACKRTVAGKTACVYRPRAMLIDNWGWCNGRNSAGNSEGRYGTTNCRINTTSVNNSGGTPFAGEIIVYPE